MTHPLEDSQSSRPDKSLEAKNQQSHSPGSEAEGSPPEENTPTSASPVTPSGTPSVSTPTQIRAQLKGAIAPLSMVETAFFASTSSLIWLINYYFPLGPVLRIFFPVPIALVYLRWGNRAAWMAASVSGLLLSVLMGPTRSILFVIPFGLLGVLLGWLWRRGATWGVSIVMGTLIGSFGFFFRIWLLSILLGEDLWLYLTTQITELADWAFLKLGLLTEPSLYLIQVMAVGMVILNNAIYLFAVHLAAALLLERVGNPIPPAPPWVQALLDEE